MPKNYPDISDEDMPVFVRRCWQRYREATEDERKDEIESLGFWIGGKYQWRPGETEQRVSKNLPWMSINRCKPSCDQVENAARRNPPGPQAHPVGGGADKDGADVVEGLIREYEYRSHAQESYILGLRYGTAGGRGCFEMATEYVDDRSMEQQIVIKPVVDPARIFYDPDATGIAREDAMWGGKIQVLSREKLIENYGPDLKVLNRTLMGQAKTAVGAWMADAFGWHGDLATRTQWSGGTSNQGPYYVCEFYLVRLQPTKLRLYTDRVMRYDHEPVPEGVERALGEVRIVPLRRVEKYVVTALDTLKKTTWPGKQVPFFWIMGPEIYRDGKLHRLSLISNAQDSQRGLNYTATSAAQIVGGMTKAPWVGPEGTFDVANAQGFNPWKASNTHMWAYMEYKPVFVDDGQGNRVLAPPPERNTWEAPIGRLMELATFFGEQIKAATSVFFEPSIKSAQEAQSGAAITALQSQTNIGTINWQDSLQYAVALSYREAAVIFKSIYDAQRVKTIVRPDGQHEIVTINKEFPAEQIDQASGKRKKSDGSLESLHNIAIGQYSLRVNAGPNEQTRAEQTIDTLTKVFGKIPQFLSNPAIAAQFLRYLGQGDPQIEAMADALMPSASGDASPQQMQMQLQQSQAMAKAQGLIIQKLQSALASKLPEVEARKWIAQLDALTKIRVAEIGKGADLAQIDADILEHLTGLAHEAGMQATDNQHAAGMQAGAQAAAAASQQQQMAADAQPQPDGEEQS